MRAPLGRFSFPSAFVASVQFHWHGAAEEMLLQAAVLRGAASPGPAARHKSALNALLC